MNEKEYLLEAIIINGDGNISAASIATLTGVLTRNACALSNQINNLSLKLERAIDD